MERLDHDELIEWMAYYGLEPWGPERSETANAIGFATVANAMGAEVNPQKLLPKWDQGSLEDQQRRAELEDELRRIEFHAAVAAHNRAVGA